MTRAPLILGVILEERFCRLPDGSIYSPSGLDDRFWQRYLIAFEQIVIIARLADAVSAESGWAKISDPRVTIRGLPTFVGPWQFLRCFFKVYRSFKLACEGAHALIVRAPGTMSLLALQLYRRHPSARIPIGVELVGDPVDVFNAGVGGRLSGLLKHIFRWSTEKLCDGADAALYVTQRTLQERYRVRKGVATFGCSDVALTSDMFALGPRQRGSVISAPHSAIAFTAATLEVPYKGIDVLIEAAALLVGMGYSLNVRIAGDGRLRPELEALSERLGVADRIAFLGRLNRNAVLDEMRSADIYVQPSLTEGLPRAVIEACATAAPIVASRVGGVTELLDAKDMVPPKDARALAERILETLIDPSRRAAMSVRNLATALEYDSTVLDARRQTFYEELRRIVINGLSK